MRRKKFVFIAGDAAHTHSSALGQGMNTGIHDAMNLAWKLAGTLKGWYADSVLETYETERRPVAERVIHLDKKIVSQLSSTKLSEHSSANQLMQESLNFSLGFGISYNESCIVKPAVSGNLVSGHRSPDAEVFAPGPATAVRLHTVLHQSKGHWNILIFTGDHVANKQKLSQFLIEAAPGISKANTQHQMRIVSIIALHTVPSTWQIFERAPPGRVYYDRTSKAYESYGISPVLGGLVVVRPDGFIAFACSLSEWHEIETFFARFCGKLQVDNDHQY